MDIKGLVIMAAGGYLIYKYLYQGNVGTPANNSISMSTGEIKAGMLASAQSNQIYIDQGNKMNIDQWNYLYQGVTGVAGPDPTSILKGQDRNTLFTLDEYWNARTNNAMSGLNYSLGLGARGAGMPNLAETLPVKYRVM